MSASESSRAAAAAAREGAAETGQGQMRDTDAGRPVAPTPPATGPHTVLQPSGWPQPKGYSNGIAAAGTMVVTGGVVGWNADGVFPADFVAQARQTFENIRAILAEAGAGPEHLVRLTWYVTSIDEYAADPKGLGAAYRAVFGRSFPTMAVMQVVRLVEPAAKIEIEATAVVPR